jgi:hypothetical protein
MPYMMLNGELIEITQEQEDEWSTVVVSERMLLSRRAELLSATDVWGLSDYPATDEQLAYRQALRDITTHPNWPNLEESDWPTHPNPITPPFEEE